MDTNDKDPIPSERNQEGNENLEPPWFTEGYIGEVEVNLASTDKCTITIDPSAPFKVEYQEKKPEKFILLASGGLLNHKEVISKTIGIQESMITGTRKPAKCDTRKAMLLPLFDDFRLCDDVFRDAPLLIMELKTRHQKARFGINKDFKVISITLI